MKFELKRLEPVIITIQGKDYPAKLTHWSMMKLEELTGRNSFEFLSRIEGLATNIKDMHAFLYVALKGGGVDIAPDDLLELDFNIIENTDIITALSELATRAVVIDTDETEIEPKKKQKQK